MLPGELAPEAGRAGGVAVFWAQRQGDEPPQPGARHPGCVECETSPGTAGVVAGAAGPVAGRERAQRVSAEGWLPSGARPGKRRVTVLSQGGFVSPGCG